METHLLHDYLLSGLLFMIWRTKTWCPRSVKGGGECLERIPCRGAGGSMFAPPMVKCLSKQSDEEKGGVVVLSLYEAHAAA